MSLFGYKSPYQRKLAVAKHAGFYLDLVMSKSPAAYYRLGESSGTTANDSSGNTNHGTITGSLSLNQTGLIPGDSNGSVAFCTSNNCGIEVPDANSLDIVGAITLEAWMKHSSSNFSGGVIWKSEPLFSGNPSQLVYEFGFLSGTLYFQASNGSSTFSVSYSFTGQAANTRHLLTATWDGTTGANAIKIMVDGVVVAQGTSGFTTIRSTNNTVKIGGKNGSGNGYEHFPGTLDEVVLLASVTTLAEHTTRFVFGT